MPESAPRRSRLTGQTAPVLTVGDLKRAIADQPDDEVITIPDGHGDYQYVAAYDLPGQGGAHSVLLHGGTPFDSRD